MSQPTFTTTIDMEAKPSDVFLALTKHISKWWTTNSNVVEADGDVLRVEFENGTYWEMQLHGLAQNSDIRWRVISAQHNLAALNKSDEWQGTDICWQIKPSPNGCSVTLTHQGLVPSLECYEICHGGWNYFLGSLKAFLETGEGYPYSG